MPGSTAAAAPKRMTLGNLASAETLDMQYNPAELDEAVAANFPELAVQGMSHQELQYASTANHAVSFTLAYDALSRMQDGYDILKARRFILSLFYSRRGATTVAAGAPPRVLFFWPEFMSLECRVLNAKFKHSRFANSGRPTAFTVALDIKEVRNVRLYSEDVLRQGTQRSGTGPA